MLASVASKAKALGHSWVARGLCSNADIFRSPAQMQAQILRFQDEFGQEHFGVPEDDFRARIVQRSEKTGKLEHSNLTVGVMEILPPVEPIAIYGVGLNYRDHAAETGKEVPRFPILFMKAPGSVTGHRTSIVIPRACQAKPEVDYEVELAVIIGKAAKNVSKAEALDFVMGYTVANDVSARRWQKKKGGGQWVFAKSFDTFCPLGPHVVPASLVPDPQNLRLRTLLNGETVQDGNTADMVFSVAELIAHASQGTTLQPGTVILTGTPSGVGYARDPPRLLQAGDEVTCQIEGIGTLTNPVEVER